MEVKDDFNNFYFEGSNCFDSTFAQNFECDEEFLQLQGNKIPKGLVSLEKLFDKHGYIKSQQQVDLESSMVYQRYNIGSDDDPKFINIGNNCTIEERDQFIQSLHQYIDVFAYSYDDLKSF